MHKKSTVTGANKLFLLFTVFYLVFQIIIAFMAAVLSYIYGADYYQRFFHENIYNILLTNQYIIILLPVIIYMLVNKLSFKEVFRLNKLDALPALLIILISVPALFTAAMLNTIVVYLLQFIGHIPAQPIPVPGNIKELITGLFVIAVSPAICEELLHRGIMLSAYENRGSIKAVVITSIIFGLFHFDITNLLGATFLGLLIGYYVIRTNSIYAGMLAHFMNNAINELMLYFWKNESSGSEIIVIPESELFASIVYGIGGLILVSVLIAVFCKATQGKAKYKPPVSNVKGDLVSILSHWPIISVLVLYIIITMFFISSIISAGPTLK
ncbi:MAG TPA: CPBP family intramembrane metalloprotease [Clostridiaceae bacterium]|nr:CPBP family intramembrane metalloprotease [Clostridiaceae bacterium]